MAYKIKINTDTCIGCGTCNAVAPKTFGMDDTNKAVITGKNGDSDETILQAAQSCPVQAITLIDDDGKQIFPVE